MSFDIRDGVTTVTSEMTVEPNPNVEEALRKGYLVLNGEEEARQASLSAATRKGPRT